MNFGLIPAGSPRISPREYEGLDTKPELQEESESFLLVFSLTPADVNEDNRIIIMTIFFISIFL